MANFIPPVNGASLGTNLEDRINRKPADQIYDQWTKNAKKQKTEKYCFLPNIQSNLKLVN